MSSVTLEDIKRMAEEKTKAAIAQKFAVMVQEAMASGQYVQADDPNYLIRRTDGVKEDFWQKARLAVLESYAMQSRAASSAHGKCCSRRPSDL